MSDLMPSADVADCPPGPTSAARSAPGLRVVHRRDVPVARAAVGPWK